jgi:hypothetical protein
MKKIPTIDLTKEDLEKIISTINEVKDSALNASVKTIIINIINLYYVMLEQIQSAKITIYKLKMLCGFKSNQPKKSDADSLTPLIESVANDNTSGSEANADEAVDDPSSDLQDVKKQKRPRNRTKSDRGNFGWDDYPDSPICHRS